MHDLLSLKYIHIYINIYIYIYIFLNHIKKNESPNLTRPNPFAWPNFYTIKDVKERIIKIKPFGHYSIKHISNMPIRSQMHPEISSSCSITLIKFLLIWLTLRKKKGFLLFDILKSYHRIYVLSLASLWYIKVISPHLWDHFFLLAGY